jgi:hypothetical protein
VNVVTGSEIINGNNQALFVVDGVPADNQYEYQRTTNRRQWIRLWKCRCRYKSNDIESINVKVSSYKCYMGQELQMGS